MSTQDNSPSQKRLLTEKELSELSGIPISTLRSHRHLRRGLPYVKVGHLVRYDRVEVEKYLTERTVRPEVT
jgi:predicted DNA-binding transcriptional regulator AlpA